jgi:hypothetical protein
VIYGNSNDPVFIKRIPLRVWVLRDEVEAVIAKRVDSGEEFNVDELIEEYKSKGPLEKEKRLSLIEGGAAPADEAQEESSSDEPPSEEKETTVSVVQRNSDNMPADKIHRAVLVLSELGMDHLYFFSEFRFTEGQSIVIEFQVPQKFIVNADVAYARAYNIKSRIISEKRLPYRVAAKFTFLKAGERTLLRQFVESIEPEVKASLPVPKPKSADAESSGLDSFDELDNLDL